jgi:16S rRNA (cytidine1402-2'-O)-methyltransferase
MPLSVCATPIGNLGDVTLRVLDALRTADLVLCEDTRRTRILLQRHGLRAKLLSYHEHNEARRTQEVIPMLEAGEAIALVSDAGLPGINDPGARLIRAAREAGIAPTVLPGPSAVETALVASGFEFDRYLFYGYLPRGARVLAGLWEELASWPHAAVAFESPARLPGSLRSLAAALPERPVAVCRELTKAFEELVCGSARDVADRFRTAPKGEITIVFGPAPARARAEDVGLEALGDLVEAGASRRQAAAVVSRLTGIPRNRLYRGSL